MKPKTIEIAKAKRLVKAAVEVAWENQRKAFEKGIIDKNTHLLIQKMLNDIVYDFEDNLEK